jgi:hypothetical protein
VCMGPMSGPVAVFCEAKHSRSCRESSRCRRPRLSSCLARS